MERDKSPPEQVPASTWLCAVEYYNWITQLFIKKFRKNEKSFKLGEDTHRKKIVL